MKFDLHIHTKYSGHSLLSPELAIEKGLEEGLDGIAITDHDSMEVYPKIKDLDKDLKVIQGEEISTDRGDVIGLFLQEEIDRDDFFEVVDEIRDQDGVVYFPHPFDSLRSESLNDEILMRYGDILETFNSRTIRNKDNERAEQIAQKEKMLEASGSDAHTQLEIGNAWIEVDEFDSKRGFLKNLEDAELHGERSPVWVHAFTKFLKVVR